MNYEILNFPLYTPINMRIYNLSKSFEKPFIEYNLENMFEFLNSSFENKECTFTKLRNRVIEKYNLNVDTDELYINFICYAYMSDIVAHIISYATTKDERHLDFFKNPNKAPLWMGVLWEDIFTTEEMTIEFSFNYSNQELNLNKQLIFDETKKVLRYRANLKIVNENIEIIDEEFENVDKKEEFQDVTLAVIIKRLHEIMDVIKKDHAGKRIIENEYLNNKKYANYTINYLFDKM